MKFAVLGSNSFSGNAFVEFLDNQGEDYLRVERPDYDLNTTLPEIMGLLDTEKPDYVVNFIAQSMVAESWAHPQSWMQTNAVGIAGLLQHLSERDWLRKYVHISTPEVYGSTGTALTEYATFNPTTPYAASRAAGDMLVNAYVKAKGFPAVITRTVNVYGVGQQLYRIIPKTILSILGGKRLPLHGGGHSTRSFIHIDDVASATYLCARQGERGKTYHSATPRQISIRGLVQMICCRMKVNFGDVAYEVGDRLGKDMNYQLDDTRIRGELGWTDTVNLEEGVDKVIAWCVENYEDLSKRDQEYRFKP